MRVLLVSANREPFPSPVVPIGVLSVAAAIRDTYDVSVCDVCFEADPHGAVQAAIASFSPDVVGIGIRNLSDNTYRNDGHVLLEAEALMGTLRGATAAPIVLGGAGFSLQPRTLLERLGGDYGVVGEGEAAFPALLTALSEGRPEQRLWSVPATRFGAVARDLVDPRYYLQDGTDNVQSRRGCAFGCTYCGYPDLEGRKLRLRPVDEVADEVIERAAAPGVTHLFFVDSVFNVPAAHSLALCEAITARGAPIPWVCYASPAGLDGRLVAAMARAGCVGAEIGTDTGTQAGLARLRKPFTLDAVRRTRAAFQSEGLADCHTFVLGAFDETEDEVQRTLDFVDTLDPDVAVFLIYQEDREDLQGVGARHREGILRTVGDAARAHPRWVVPELGIRFGPKIHRLMARMGTRGPSWLSLARSRSLPDR